MRLTNRLYEKKIRKYFPYFRTIEIRKFIAQANEHNICIIDEGEVVKYINKIIDGDINYIKLRTYNLFYKITTSKKFNKEEAYTAFSGTSNSECDEIINIKFESYPIKH